MLQLKFSMMMALSIYLCTSNNALAMGKIRESLGLGEGMANAGEVIDAYEPAVEMLQATAEMSKDRYFDSTPVLNACGTAHVKGLKLVSSAGLSLYKQLRVEADAPLKECAELFCALERPRETNIAVLTFDRYCTPPQ